MVPFDQFHATYHIHVATKSMCGLVLSPPPPPILTTQKESDSTYESVKKREKKNNIKKDRAIKQIQHVRQHTKYSHLST